MDSEKWNQRYNTDEYVYGEKPNDFLVSFANQIPQGNVLCLAEGEGRNAVYLAKLGYEVYALDYSSAGMEKTQSLAKKNGVTVTTEVIDLAIYNMVPNKWDAIISIFCHLPENIRQPLHKKVINGLKPGGLFILEAYTPRQLEYQTGGPKDLNLLYKLSSLRDELKSLEFIHSREVVRDIYEGRLHTGKGSVVQIIARKQDRK